MPSLNVNNPSRNRRTISNENVVSNVMEAIPTIAPAPETPQDFNCPICHITHPISLQTNVINDSDDIIICAPCAATEFCECHNCHLLTNTLTSTTSNEGNRYCEVCFNDNFFICEACHRNLNNDNYGPSNDGNCADCHRELNGVSIQEYSSKPKRITLDEGKIFDQNAKTHTYKNRDIVTDLGITISGKIYLGVELEVECNGGNNKLAAKEVGNLFEKDFIIMKRDGSLSNGFEIVTVPATLEDQKAKWNNFFNHIPSNIHSYDAHSCGFHVHCSRKPLSALQIGKVVVFVNEPRNLSFIKAIAGRDFNNYSRRKDKKLCAETAYRSDERYEAVNLTNKTTIEFRIFKGTLKKETIYRYMEFCHALIRFCATGAQVKSLTPKTIGKIIPLTYKDCESVKKFIEFVDNNKSVYPHLYAFICAVWLGKEWINPKDKTKLHEKFGFKLKVKGEEEVKGPGVEN